MGEISSAEQVQKASTEDHLIDHVAWSFLCFYLFIFLRQQDPHTNLEINPRYSKLDSSLQCDWRWSHPSFPLSDSFLQELQGRKQILPLNTSTLHSIQTEGARECCPPKRFRCSSQSHGAPGFTPHWSNIWRLGQAHASVQAVLSWVLHRCARAWSLPRAGQHRRTDLQGHKKYY